MSNGINFETKLGKTTISLHQVTGSIQQGVEDHQFSMLVEVNSSDNESNFKVETPNLYSTTLKGSYIANVNAEKDAKTLEVLTTQGVPIADINLTTGEVTLFNYERKTQEPSAGCNYKQSLCIQGRFSDNLDDNGCFPYEYQITHNHTNPNIRIKDTLANQ